MLDILQCTIVNVADAICFRLPPSFTTVCTKFRGAWKQVYKQSGSKPLNVLPSLISQWTNKYGIDIHTMVRVHQCCEMPGFDSVTGEIGITEHYDEVVITNIFGHLLYCSPCCFYSVVARPAKLRFSYHCLCVKNEQGSNNCKKPQYYYLWTISPLLWTCPISLDISLNSTYESDRVLHEFLPIPVCNY